MGTWSEGSFGNDDALDFIDSITSINDLQQFFKKLIGLNTEKIPYPLSAQIIAAADIIAAILGRPSDDLPEEISTILTSSPSIQDDMRLTVIKAVQKVKFSSELADLWRENPDQLWDAALDDLLQRLDLTKPYDRIVTTPQDLSGLSCLICEEKIEMNKLVTIKIPPENGSAAIMEFYFHQKCLATTFSHPFFDDANETHINLIRQIKNYLGF